MNINPTSGSGYVRLETHQGICSIEFFHPQSNSLPANLLHEIARQIHVAGADVSVKVIILRSAGDKAFCAGASFEELLAIANQAEGQQFFSGFAHVINTMRKCSKFIIARIHGKCVGGGVGLAAAADYAIAKQGADIKLSELAMGIGPFVVGPAVERKIGKSAFSQLAIDSSLWRNGDWAQRKGLYAELHESVEGMDESIRRLAASLAHANPAAMEDMKKMFWHDAEHWDQLLNERAAISGSLVLSQHSRDAIAKFKKK